MTTILLDSEAVAALLDDRHAHHREVLWWVHSNRGRHRSFGSRRSLVPTAVRAEAGWDRTDGAAAFINHLRISDVPLDATATNAAATLRTTHGVSVADAHLGAAIHAQPDGEVVVVLTSDPGDIQLVAGNRAVRVIRL